MKRLLWLLMFAAPVLHAQYVPFQNFCVQSATQANISGLKSQNYLQGIIPYCTVTVFLGGTTNKANLYSNSTGTVKTNPFDAPAGGQWLFYADPGQGYDVVLSGGHAPNTYPAPVTLTGLTSGGGGGGGTPAAPANSIQIANGTATAFDSDPQITIDKTLHTINVQGPIAGPHVTVGPVSTVPSDWTLDLTTPGTACSSIGCGGGGTTPIGTLYSANTWADLSAFTNNGSTQTVIAAGTGSCPAGTNTCIQFTGGAGTFTQTLNLTAPVTLSPIWTLNAQFILGTLGASAYGLAFGTNSQTGSAAYSDLFADFAARTGADTGTTYIVGGQRDVIVATSSDKVTPHTGDKISITLTRFYNLTTATTVDLTTGATSSSASYTFGVADPVSPANAYLPNLGQFAIYNLGGTQTLTSLSITSGLAVGGGQIAILEDSKGEYFAGTYAAGWATSLQQNWRTIPFGGPSSVCSDYQADLTEILAIKPSYLLFLAPGNDVRYSVSLPTTEACIGTIMTAAANAGINAYITTYPLENSGTNFGPLNTYITSTYPTKYIDLSCGFVAGSVPATWLDADNVHPYPLYHQCIAQTITQRLQKDGVMQQFPYYVTP